MTRSVRGIGPSCQWHRCRSVVKTFAIAPNSSHFTAHFIKKYIVAPAHALLPTLF